MFCKQTIANYFGQELRRPSVSQYAQYEIVWSYYKMYICLFWLINSSALRQAFANVLGKGLAMWSVRVITHNASIIMRVNVDDMQWVNGLNDFLSIACISRIVVLLFYYKWTTVVIMMRNLKSGWLVTKWSPEAQGAWRGSLSYLN